MRVPALVLFTRELRVDVRRKRSHLLRLAFVGLIFLALAAAEAASRTTGAPGLDFFRSISYFNFGMLTLAGVGYFATTVTEDKDEGTFDLLKLAGIGPLGLLLGKSTTRLLALLLILAVQLPFTFLAVTLGGVLPSQVLAMYASLAAYAILLANVGLVCSVVSRGSAMATGVAAILLGLYLVGIPAVQDLWTGMTRGGVLNPNSESGRSIQSLVDWLREFSIWYRMSDVLKARFAGEVWSAHIGYSLIAGGVLFVLSWGSLWLVTRADAGRRTPFGRVRRRGAAEQTRVSRRAWSSALLWKELHGVWGGPWALLVPRTVLYIAVPVAFAWLTWTPPVRRLEWKSFTEAVMALMLILLAAESSICASLVFRGEVHRRTLPLLILLPVSTAHIAWTKVAAAALQLIPAASVFALAAATYPDGPVAAVRLWLASPAEWLLLLQFLMFLHATAYFSLVVKWGALPLAFVAVFASTYAFGLCCILPLSAIITGSLDMGEASRWASFIVPMILAAGAIMIALQVAIAERLRASAANSP